MNDIYFKKYMKYKYKYLNVKSKIENQDGGMKSHEPYFKLSADVVDTKKRGTFRKTLEFGIFIEKRKGVTDSYPYVKIDGKIYEIAYGFNIDAIKDRKQTFLEKKIVTLYEKTCYDIGGIGFKASGVCNNEKRGKMSITVRNITDFENLSLK